MQPMELGRAYSHCEQQSDNLRPLFCSLQPYSEASAVSRRTDRPFAFSGVMLRMVISSIVLLPLPRSDLVQWLISAGLISAIERTACPDTGRSLPAVFRPAHQFVVLMAGPIALVPANSVGHLTLKESIGCERFLDTFRFWSLPPPG